MATIYKKPFSPIPSFLSDRARARLAARVKNIPINSYSPLNQYLPNKSYSSSTYGFNQYSPVSQYSSLSNYSITPGGYLPGDSSSAPSSLTPPTISSPSQQDTLPDMAQPNF